MMRPTCPVVLTASALLFSLPAAPAASPAPPTAPVRGLHVFPENILLQGRYSQQQLGVLGSFADGRQRDLTGAARFESSDPAVVRVEARGRVRPVATGQAAITIQAGGQVARVPVRVQQERPAPVGFVREVLPVLTRAGCNQGACHGSEHGKAGFHLSLFGYDPAADYRAIAQAAEGRRLVPSDPERSLILLKPTLQMEHGGGERFGVGSRSYETLVRWIEDGMPTPTAKDPEVRDLQVWPARRLMIPGEEQQILVRAIWSDGRVDDVTDWAQFDAFNEAVATVTPAGRITARGRGESHIMVRFQGQAAVVRVTLPYASPQPTQPIPTWNFIDEKLTLHWRDLGLTPSPLCGDEDFLRRLYLDAIGTLPTPAEVRDFLADPREDKRYRAIDRVLERPEFVDFWALKWGDLLRINSALLNDRGVRAFHGWVRTCLQENRPLDAMTRELLTARGGTFTSGPANFYMISPAPADCAETTGQVFLGVRLQCARCHHHPFEKWGEEDFYGLAAFFSRVAMQPGKGNERESVIYLKEQGEQMHPRRDAVVPPRLLDGPAVNDPVDRRRRLADWITAADNPFFARNLANRFWSYLMGRGLVEPVDDLRATNPASNPELLDALAADLVAHHYDLRHLMRTIFRSRAYHLSSRKAPGNEADVLNVYHTRYTLKRLTAEQLADAVDFATGVPEVYGGQPAGTRAIQLPDPRIRSAVLDVFGRPQRLSTCECERVTQPNLAQALYLLNDEQLERKLTAPGGRLARLLQAQTPPAALVEELYLVTLSRLPSSAEQQQAQARIQNAASLKEGAVDLLWALLNCREFQFNH